WHADTNPCPQILISNSECVQLRLSSRGETEPDASRDHWARCGVIGNDEGTEGPHEGREDERGVRDEHGCADSAGSNGWGHRRSHCRDSDYYAGEPASVVRRAPGRTTRIAWQPAPAALWRAQPRYTHWRRPVEGENPPAARG